MSADDVIVIYDPWCSEVGSSMKIYQHSTLVKIFYTIYVGIIHVFEGKIRSESITFY